MSPKFFSKSFHRRSIWRNFLSRKMPTSITLPDSDKEAKDGSGYSHDKRSITFSDDDIEKKGADKADDNDGEAESLSPEKNVA